MVGWSLTASLGLACAHKPTTPAPQDWDYVVRGDRSLAQLEIHQCFAQQLPPRLIADDPEAARYVTAAYVLPQRRPVTIDVDNNAIVIGHTRNRCLAYVLDLARMSEEVSLRHMVRVGSVVATSPHLLLWRPETLFYETDVTLTFDLPAEVSVSVPWPHHPDDPKRYHLAATTFTWAGQVLLGEFHALEISAAGATFSVAVMDRPHAITDRGLEQWLRRAAETVASLYGGTFPVPRLQVIVVPYSGGGDPVYFGLALRGGGPAVQLLISDTAKDADFPGEWVAIHEMLHHGMPFIDHAEAWLSEGFVTYYTEVLRGRMGLLSERAAWQAIMAGMDRGKATSAELTLGQASREMHVHRAYQHVYWGGAAIALLADVALRAAGSSLDHRMHALQRCCAQSPRIWTAPETVAAMDAADPSTPSMEKITTSVLHATGFPELAHLYRRLGLVVVDGNLTLEDSAPFATIRRAIIPNPATTQPATGDIR